MAIDIRATVTCSLGTLISGSISDDYIQGSGLVKTRGSVEISALITPAIGTAVTFSYVKDGVTRSIPRKLRVLSSFADPFRRTTKVELGCKLTYLSDLKEAVDWSAFDDPENAGYDEDDARIVTLPIHASSVMNQCLTQLGITASSNPLTNKFSIAAFDFSPGYVQVLSDLLVSESYCGYLNTNEVLQVFNLDQDAGTGPVFTSADIVDLGPIGVGQLPGEAVTVSYSTLKLKAPDNNASQEDTERRNWEREETIGTPQLYYVKYTNQNGNQQTVVYTGVESTVTTATYKSINYNGQTQDVVDTRTTINYGPSIKNLTSYATAILSNTTGVSFNNVQMELEKTIETFSYTEEGVQTGSDKLFYKDNASAIGQLALPFAFASDDYVTLSFGLRLVGRIVETYEQQGEYRKTVTETYKWWPETLAGQQGVAESRDTFTTSSQVVSYINSILPPDDSSRSRLALEGVITQTRTASVTDSQGRPLPAERTNQQYAKGGDPNNGWRTESKADLELAVGSATAQRRIELSMPYAPDDTFKELINPLTGLGLGVFTSEASDAPAKANRYGRVQNRLLLGNRSGINLQLAPERLPAAPYSPLYLQASGLTALYRANGTNWAFDSNGIVCSVDALFWAAVGGTGTFWFPVAPGVTTLPAEPAIVDGQTTATSTILPYNETAIYDSRIRLTTAITKFDYALELLTTVTPTPVKLKTVVQRAIPAAAGAFTLSGQDAQFRRGLRLTANAAAFTLTDQFVRIIPDRLYPVDPGIFTLSLQPSALSYSGGDQYWNNVSLLLHMNGTDLSTTFTDSGPLALSGTAFSQAKISTTQSKFGGASGLFDGINDRVVFADNDAWHFGADNFTIESWMYTSSGGVIACHYNNSSFTNSSWMFYADTGQLIFWFSTTGSNWIEVRRSFSSSISSSWAHVVVCRSGSNLRLFVNGVQAGTTYSIGTNTLVNSPHSMYVGNEGGGANSFNGYLDDLRITKAARYTANFTPPLIAFPDGPQTV